MFRNLPVVVLLLLQSYKLPAQTTSLYFERLTVQNGLSNNKVNCILQDKRGFIWLGTDDGLSRYDGYNFVIFRHQPGNPNTISGNIISDIVEDAEGVLWIATTDGGLTRYDHNRPPKEQFIQYQHIPGDSTSIPDNIINTLLFDSDGYLWMGTGVRGVVRFDPRKGKFIEPVVKGTKTIFDLCMDNHGIIWAGKAGGGLLKINPRTLSYESDDRYIDLYNKLPHSTVTALYSDKGKNMWYGSWDKVLYRQPDGSVPEQVFQQTSAPGSFRNDEIDCFAEDAQGRLWMGGHYAGLHIYDQHTGRFYVYQYDASKEGTIADNQVNSLCIDQDGAVWIGTSKGVSILHPLQQQFQQVFLPSSKTGNDAPVIYDFYTDTNKDLWIGTSDGLYIRSASDSSLSFVPVIYKGNKLSVTCFFKDADGTFYIGTNYSLFRYDPLTRQVSLLPNTDKDQVMNKIIDSRVISMIRDSIENHPVLLVSPYGHYITYYDFTENRWISRMDTLKKILKRFNMRDNLILKIYKAKNGKIWLANTKMGLGKWTNQTLPKVDYLINMPGNAGSISNNNVRDIEEDSQGNFWVSTYGGGLNYFNISTEKFTHIPITNNLLEGLQLDARGSVWMISNGNLHKYDPVRQVYTSYILPDIDKSGGVHGKIYKDNKGTLYTAGKGYFIAFDPLSIRDAKRIPEVALTDFKIFNQSFTDLLTHKEIELNYDENYFTIEFAAPDFSAERNIRYSYMLEGRDKSWINIGSRNFEQFSNLDGGTYTFKVKASANTGLLNDKIASLKIIIIPPFWKHWWFYALCTLATAVIIYILYRYRINEILKRQAIRNKIAQDLHDNVGSTLSSISVYSQVAKIYNEQQRKDELQQTIEKIRHTSSEMISEMNDIVWAINPRHDNMETILQRMESYARPLLASKNITFHFVADPAIEQVHLEMTRRKNFYLIFKEAINNALKYSGCKNIWVHIGLKQSHLNLNVKDDGIGFDKEQVKRQASQSMSGNGLRNMDMRSAEMKGALSIRSGVGQGTTVYLQFPIT